MQKLLFLHEGARQTKSQAISTPRFSLCDKLSGWPASGFRVLSQRDIYGTFCLGTIYLGKAGRRRNIVDQLAVVAKTGGRKPQDCGRERVCNMPPLAATCRSR